MIYQYAPIAHVDFLYVKLYAYYSNELFTIYICENDFNYQSYTFQWKMVNYSLIHVTRYTYDFLTNNFTVKLIN